MIGAAPSPDHDRGVGVAPKELISIRRRLLRWYDLNKRDLPWRRRAGDAYATWVAEIMLQQTRVETVLAYYEPFLRRFPTMLALARATDHQLLKQWEGLGYYRRALLMHRTAKTLVAHGRELPDTVDELWELPGIGVYTAAAVASIAFGGVEAAVDGNVARVIARLFGVHDDVLSPAGRGRVRVLAEALLSSSRPGDFNQAWMDLGSGVCTPRSPDCACCPIAAHCVALEMGETETLPIRNGKVKVVDVSLVAAIFLCDGRFLMRRRPVGGLWSGLWEVPTLEAPKSSKGGSARSGVKRPGKRFNAHTSESATRRRRSALVRRMAREEGLAVTASPRHVGVVRHKLTHRAMTFEVYVAEVRCKAQEQDRSSRRWVTRAGSTKLAVSTACRRILAAKQTAADRLTPPVKRSVKAPQ